MGIYQRVDIVAEETAQHIFFATGSSISRQNKGPLASVLFGFLTMLMILPLA